MLSDPAQPAADLLAAVQARYELSDVQPVEKLPGTHGIVGRAPYLAHGQVGQVADDTPGLIVHMLALETQTQAAEYKAAVSDYLTTHRVRFSLRLMREHPHATEGKPAPAADKITAASLTLIRDAARLKDAVTAWGAALPSAYEVGIGEVEPQGPSGKHAGNRLSVSLGPL